MVKGANNDDVEFFVKNFASDEITVNSISFEYSIEPEAFFNQLKVGGSQLIFKVTNFGSSSVFVTSIRLTYSSTPAAYFEKIKFGKTWVFDYANNGNVRLGSGDLITFAAEEVKGSGKPNEIVPIRIESDQTLAPDVTIKGVGKTVEIKVEEFIDTNFGAGNDVSMSGVEMTVDFSDGSSNTFTIP